jgi:asparaginyl-tRNA synthetase
LKKLFQFQAKYIKKDGQWHKNNANLAWQPAIYYFCGVIFLKMKRIKIKELLKSNLIDTEVVVKGWVRTRRGNKNIVFIALNDGSTINNIQIVADTSGFDEALLKDITTGACIAVSGKLVKSQGQGQSVEVAASTIELYGKSDAETYPLQKKGHSMEFLREIAYLRPRTNTFGAVLRIRHAMAFAIHKYFNDKGFFYLHTPIITGSDAEGAGEMFHVTTLDLAKVPLDKNGSPDFSQDFFGKATNLTARRRTWSPGAWRYLYFRPHIPGGKFKYPKTPRRILDD